MWPARAGVSGTARRISLGFLAVALLATGCTLATGPPAAGRTSIRVAVISGTDTAPLVIAVKEGLFRDRGLSVVVKTYSSLRPEFQALKKGSVDIAVGDYADFLYEDAVGKASLHLVADGYDANSGVIEVLSLPSLGITTPQGLVNKVVATPEPQLIPSSNGPYTKDSVPYSIETLATESVLNSDGVTPAGVTWKPTRPQDMIRELRQGQVSAIVATEPYITEAESQLGAVEVMDSCSGLTANLPLSGYFSLAAYAGTHRAQLQQFQSALRLAQANASSGGSLQAMLPHFTGMSMQDAALVTIGSFPTSLIVGQVQRVADLMYDSGVISTPLSVSRLASG
jgi:NitT/TauT family transport system substrate-binding protein